jgi:predicted RNA-binding Zn-ribbon protein involved in translation (DUF1610 family)
MKKPNICTTSKQKLDAGSTSFLCPSCQKEKINRSFHCRQIASKYKCPGCGFEGPN